LFVIKKTFPMREGFFEDYLRFFLEAFFFFLAAFFFLAILRTSFPFFRR